MLTRMQASSTIAINQRPDEFSDRPAMKAAIGGSIARKARRVAGGLRLKAIQPGSIPAARNPSTTNCRPGRAVQRNAGSGKSCSNIKPIDRSMRINASLEARLGGAKPIRSKPIAMTRMLDRRSTNAGIGVGSDVPPKAMATITNAHRPIAHARSEVFRD